MLDIFLSEARARRAQLALFIDRDGYWRKTRTRVRFLSIVARAARNAHGVTVALAGYDLCPQVGIGDIVNQMRRACYSLWRQFNRTITCCLRDSGRRCRGDARHRLVATLWRAEPDSSRRSRSRHCSIFSPLIGDDMNADFKLDAAEARIRLGHFIRGSGRRHRRRTFEKLRSSARVAAGFCARAGRSWRHGSAPASLLRSDEVAGANHLLVIEPLARSGQRAVVKRHRLRPHAAIASSPLLDTKYGAGGARHLSECALRPCSAGPTPSQLRSRSR